jgi:tripartite-type tricarboxylate transporter receptor subunit TctC
MKLASAIAAAGLLAAIGYACAASAASYPDHPITLINPYAAGGPSDLVARGLARALEKQLGKPIIVENKPGGGASIGTGFVARAKPDGYTLLISTSAGHVVTPLMQKTTYDGVQGFAFCSIVAVQPIMLVANSSKGFKSVADVIARARAEPGKITYGSAGVGGATHLEGELFQQEAKIKLTHVPYPGAAPAMTDLVSGQIDLGMLNLSAELPFLKQGRLVALAYAADRRSPLMPEVPTLAEAGVPGPVAATWYSLAAPAGTPPAVVEQLSAAVRKANQDPDYQRIMREQAIDLMALTPAEATQYVEKDQSEMRKLIKQLGLEAQ